MRTAKIIVGIICLAIAIYLTPFCFGMFLYSELLFKFFTLFFWCGLIVVGVFLIRRRKLPLSKGIRSLILLFLGVAIAGPIILDIHIRHERAALQMRAKEFLLRPIPKLLIPDSEGEVGGYYVDTNAGIANGVFGYSRALIERYATKGRIRWSAAIQGEFACTGDNCLNPNISDEVTGNKEVRRYSTESRAILVEEWRMGYWQFVEDSIEFKSVIPEIEEEDQYNGWIHQLEGTWTNENSETMTISPNGTFSARWGSPVQTNIFKGTELFMGGASVLRVIRDTQSVFLQDGDKKDIRILHVDGHNLIYELDGQTNSMSR